VKILAVFGLVLLLSRSRLHLGFALLVGALVLGLWSGQSSPDLAGIALRVVTGWSTFYLVAIIVLILLLSRLMEQSGHLQRIVYAFALVVRSRRALSALVPALIGLLPMPGGALFSAPLVKKTVEEVALPEEQKAVINYWFRHVWEYWWPLYPGFILAVGLLGVPAWQLMLVQFPLALFCVSAGVVFLLLPLKGLPRRSGPSLRGESFLMLIRESMPILAVLGVILVLNVLRRLLGEIGLAISCPPELSVLVGIMVCIGMVIRTNRLGTEDIARALRDRKYFDFVFLVLGIMIFKGVLTGSSVVLDVKDELLSYRIPLLLVITLLPFISGLVTGIAVGFVGASFPVILPLLAGLPPLSTLAHAALAYSCGYMGMMLSPVHLCLLVSKDYFQAGFPSCYRLLLPLAALTLLLSFVYFVILIHLAG
jgi:integral membrane protein (TIGR00529 family)